jgi:hypothetical protein
MKKLYNCLMPSKSFLLILPILINISNCQSCGPEIKVYEKENFQPIKDNKSQQINISLKTEGPLELHNFRGGLLNNNSVTIPIVLKNEGSFSVLNQESLEKITLKITNQENVDKIMYVTKAVRNSKDFTQLKATEYSEINNNSITLWEFLKVFNLTDISSGQEKHSILNLYPKDIELPSSFTIQLEGSVSNHKTIDVVWKSPIDLAIKIAEDVKHDFWGLTEPLDEEGDFHVEFVVKKKAKSIDLTPDVLEACGVKITNVQNIAKIFYAIGRNSDNTYRTSNVAFDSFENLWDMLEFSSPQGIIGGAQGKMQVWVKPEDVTKQASFTMEVMDNNLNIIDREKIIWNHSFSKQKYQH